MDKKQTYIALAVIVLLLVIGLVAYVNLNSSNKPAVLSSLSIAKGVDSQGNPTGVSTTFNSKSDKQIYAVMSLKNAKKSTTVAYARYFNGKFIDSKVTHPSADGVSSVYFIFEKGVGMYPKGNYKVVSYVNGKHALEANYAFK